MGLVLTRDGGLARFLRGAVLFRDTLAWLGRGSVRRRWPQVLQQMFEIGNRSVVFITVTMGVLGMITVLQALMQLEQILPDFSMVGPAFIQSMVRAFGPTVTALMIATRVGSGIAAEIGSMVVTEQVDALRMCNADPIDYLVTPRFVACTLMTLMLTIYGILVGVLCGAAVAMNVWEILPENFFRLDLVKSGDVISAILKCVAYGMAIPIVSSQAGLETTGGSEGVGAATTRAVVAASFSVVVLDLLVSGLSYVFLMDAPA